MFPYTRIDDATQWIYAIYAAVTLPPDNALMIDDGEEPCQF
jgi:hypothetical protein